MLIAWILFRSWIWWTNLKIFIHDQLITSRTTTCRINNLFHFMKYELKYLNFSQIRLAWLHTTRIAAELFGHQETWWKGYNCIATKRQWYCYKIVADIWKNRLLENNDSIVEFWRLRLHVICKKIKDIVCTKPDQTSKIILKKAELPKSPIVKRNQPLRAIRKNSAKCLLRLRYTENWG